MLRTRWPIAAPRASVATSAAGQLRRVALPQRRLGWVALPQWRLALPQRLQRQPPSPCRRQARQRRQHTARSLCLRRAPRCYLTGRRASEPAMVRSCMQVRVHASEGLHASALHEIAMVAGARCPACGSASAASSDDRSGTSIDRDQRAMCGVPRCCGDVKAFRSIFVHELLCGTCIVLLRTRRSRIYTICVLEPFPPFCLLRAARQRTAKACGSPPPSRWGRRSKCPPWRPRRAPPDKARPQPATRPAPGT